MTAEQIIRSGTEDLTGRRDELTSLYRDDTENSIGGEFLLEEIALIDMELNNRGYKLLWQRGQMD